VTLRRLRLAIAALAAAGAGLTGYLTATSLLAEPALCPTDGCEIALASTYSELLGIPVSALGFGAYLAILASAVHPRGALVGAAVALGGLGFAAYLVVLLVAVLEAVCVLCMVSHGILATLAVLTVLRLARDRGPA
jgi:uncharacterized membrane protein